MVKNPFSNKSRVFKRASIKFQLNKENQNLNDGCNDPISTKPGTPQFAKKTLLVSGSKLNLKQKF